MREYTGQKTALNIVMGAMTFGKEGTSGARLSDPKEISAILDTFQKHGHWEVDAARVYCGGTNEEYLATAGWKERGLMVDTKLYPNKGTPMEKLSGQIISHNPKDLRKYLDVSLKALNTDKIDMWYLHGPDRTTDYAVTLKTIDELHREGKFNRFGISNYTAWEVAEMIGICNQHGYIKPSVYQGLYCAIHRAVELELLPCLRKYNIAFFAFNPLAGGFFTGRYSSVNSGADQGSRFDSETWQGKSYRQRYWNEAYFNAMAAFKPVAEKHGLTLPEIALRWMSHHSQLKREYGDAVIIGASSLSHIEQNLLDFEKGPLPDEVAKALDDAWLAVRAVAVPYFH